MSSVADGVAGVGGGPAGRAALSKRAANLSCFVSVGSCVSSGFLEKVPFVLRNLSPPNSDIIALVKKLLLIPPSFLSLS